MYRFQMPSLYSGDRAAKSPIKDEDRECGTSNWQQQHEPLHWGLMQTNSIAITPWANWVHTHTHTHINIQPWYLHGPPFRYRKNDFDFSRGKCIISITSTVSDSQRFIISHGLSLLVCWCPVGVPLLHSTATFLSVKWLPLSLSSTIESISFAGGLCNVAARVCACIPFWRVEARGVESATSTASLWAGDICWLERDGFNRWGGLLSYSDCCAHMDSGLVRPSILAAACEGPSLNVRRAPCVHKISGLGGECLPSWSPTVLRSLPQLYWTDWRGSHLGHISWPISDMSRLWKGENSSFRTVLF